MAPTPAKSLSPAELAKLEHAFATDPASEAYRPLAEAYLGMGRFMEAMVVCKKGVKAHPTDADPRLLLARVYAEQGKDKKALEELAAALQVAPTNKNLLRMTGALQLKTGEADAGKANLLKAFEADPTDAETQAALAQWKIEPPRPAAPEPPTERVQVGTGRAPMAGPGAMAPQIGRGPSGVRQVPGQMIQGGPSVVVDDQGPPQLSPEPRSRPAMAAGGAPQLGAEPRSRPSMPGASAGAPQLGAEPRSRPSMSGAPALGSEPRTRPGMQAPPLGQAPRPSGQHAAQGMNGAQGRGQAPAIGRGPSQTRPAAQRPPPPARAPVQARSDEDVDLDDDESSGLRPRSRKKSGITRYFFFLLALGIPLALGGYWFIGQRNARITRDFNKALSATTEQFKHDSYDSYKKACENADKALELKPDSAVAHSYLAYAWAIRWGEHGGGDEARNQAERHLEAAKAGGDNSAPSYLYAADALIQNYGGKGGKALGTLKDQVNEFNAEGKQSSLLNLTLGILQMNAGDLEGARESLEKAQTLAPDDPRIYSALGSLYRRRGQDRLAWQMYDFSLRYEKDHPESLLGRSLLILDQDDPAYDVAAKMLKKLIEADPPPSPRQLAMAYAARALLVSRVTAKLAETSKPDEQKSISDATSVPLDPAKARAEIADAEDKAAKLDRGNPDLLLIKGQRLHFEGNLDGAAAAIRQAIKMDDSRAQFHSELAKVLMEKPGGEREAKDALETALKTMDSPKLRVLLGSVYRKLGNLDEAIAQYTKASSDPKTKNPEARLALGTVLREKKDYAKAQEALEKAAQEYVSTPSRVAASYTELGRVFEEKGDRPKADETYQKALNADVDYAPAYYFYGRFLAADPRSASKARDVEKEYLKREPKGEYAADAQRLSQ